MRVRRAALDRVGEATIRRGTPLALLEEALVPVFLHHRYQVDAAASALGGQYYGYALRGDGAPPRRPVPAAEQRAALEALAATLTSAELVVPTRILDMLAPRPSGYDAHRELFPRYTGLPFDPVTPGLTAADVTLAAVLDPERAARLVSQAAYDASLPSFGDVVDRLATAILQDRGPGVDVLRVFSHQPPAHDVEWCRRGFCDEATQCRFCTISSDNQIIYKGSPVRKPGNRMGVGEFQSFQTPIKADSVAFERFKKCFDEFFPT